MDEPADIFPAPAYADFVLPHWQAARQRGQRCALLTIVANTGSSPRPVGSQLAVSEDGRALGLLSGGCIEGSLVRDALSALAAGTNHLERYGAGSRFIDLRLPCGSGIDIYFDVTMPDAVGEGILAARAQRRPVTLLLDMAAQTHRLVPGEVATGRADGGPLFARLYRPGCRLVMAGAGPILPALAALCRVSEIAVEAVTTDPATAGDLAAAAVPVRLVPRWTAVDWADLDRWTGLVLLSHDHDDEAAMLAPALASQAFYVGALGSRKTQNLRRNRLLAAGLEAAAVDRVRGPVGLPIGAATPPEIAVSVLAELIDCWRHGPARSGAVPEADRTASIVAGQVAVG